MSGIHMHARTHLNMCGSLCLRVRPTKAPLLAASVWGVRLPCDTHQQQQEASAEPTQATSGQGQIADLLVVSPPPPPPPPPAPALPNPTQPNTLRPAPPPPKGCCQPHLEVVAAQQPLTAWRQLSSSTIQGLIAGPACLTHNAAVQPPHNAACAGLAPLNHMKTWDDGIYTGHNTGHRAGHSADFALILKVQYDRGLKSLVM